MRRLARVAVAVITVFFLIGVFAVLWVDRALANIGQPSPVCLAESDRKRIAVGTFWPDRRDSLITKSLNFQQGVPKTMLWWHLRGAAIHLTYVTFWSSGKRNEIFKQVTATMRVCPPRSSWHD